MKPRSEEKVWTIEVAIEESADETEAKAALMTGERTVAGWGRARRNPADPDMPRVGEELAVSRALSELSHKLFDEAVDMIEQHEGHHVTVRGS